MLLINILISETLLTNSLYLDLTSLTIELT